MNDDAELQLEPVTSEDSKLFEESLNSQLLLHYYKNIEGEPVRSYKVANLPDYVPNPLCVIELALSVAEMPARMYITVGASRLPMPYPAGYTGQKVESRMELFAYVRESDEEVARFLAGLARYPFRANTFFDVDHTMEFSGNRGLVKDSPLTAGVFTLPFYEGKALELKSILYKDGSHAHILWFLPLYPMERRFFKERGPSELFNLFVDNDIDLADPWRPSIIV